MAASLVAVIMGATSSGSFNLNLNFGDIEEESEVVDGSVGNAGAIEAPEFLPGVIAIISGILLYIALVALVFTVVRFFLGSVVDVGHKSFYMGLVNGEAPRFKLLFSYFPNWSSALVARLLVTLYTFLWGLLLVVPGIIAAYSYSMTSYILAENPGLSARDAMNESKRLMNGNKWRLFCLHFSFIGWEFLCGLTFGIGYIALIPYQAAAEAAFYQEIAHPADEYNGGFAGFEAAA